MADKKAQRDSDSEKMEQYGENKRTEDQAFNEGGNASDYDGGHPEDSQSESDGRIENGESYARRQHGKDEMEK